MPEQVAETVLHASLTTIAIGTALMGIGGWAITYHGCYYFRSLVKSAVALGVSGGIIIVLSILAYALSAAALGGG